MKIDTPEILAYAREQGWPIADETTVRELVFEWRDGLQRCIDKPREKEIGYVDAFMALANFVRLVIEDLEQRQKFDNPAARLVFRQQILQTIERGLLHAKRVIE